MRRIALTLLLAPALFAAPAAARTHRCPDRTVRVVAGHASWISLACPGLHRSRAVIVRGPVHGAVGRVDQRRDRVRYRPQAGYSGRDALRIRYVHRHRRATGLVRVRVRGAGRPGQPGKPPPPVGPGTAGAPGVPAAPPGPVPVPGSGADATGPGTGGDYGVPVPAPVRCTGLDVPVNYMAAETFTVRCSGPALAPLTLSGTPAHGTLSGVHTGGTVFAPTLTATYTPDARYVGSEPLTVVTSDIYGTTRHPLELTVRPWRMRAIGDSVTAGFGYYGDGSQMGLGDLLSCKPPAVVNNRCSSNSDARDGYGGPPAWSPDFGYANDIAWPAQFAHTWQGGGHITAASGMFENRAVTGSAPSDWLPGGILSGRLDAIIAEDPDLVPMTMGANPLLSNILLTAHGEECSLETTVATLRACIKPFFDEVDLTANLQRLYTRLLTGTEHTQVVAFQYDLSIPSANAFDVWQLEQMIAYFNEQILNAVVATKAALPAAQAQRLTIIPAASGPGDLDPLKLPWFSIGTPPQQFDTWTGAYDCGLGDHVDGRSHQSGATQDEMRIEHPLTFCPGTAADEWVISADTGIHPTQAGYTQFAQALTNVVTAGHLIPPLP